MNCVHFARILADFHEGKLSAREKQAAVEHVDRCPTCKRLLAVATGNSDILPEAERDGLAGSILERTIGGPVCPRVESLLWDFVKGEQDPEESHLIDLHLEHCDGCRAMAADLQPITDRMAEVMRMYGVTADRLRGRPMVVGGDPDGRGVVAAASYEAGFRGSTPLPWTSGRL